MRSRAYTGKPARQLRSAWTEAFDDPKAPARCRCRCRASSTKRRRAGSCACTTSELTGFPVGQIVGRMNARRPAGEVVHILVEEWITATERLYGLIEE